MAKLYNEQTITDVGGSVEAYENNAGQVLMGLDNELTDLSKEMEKDFETAQNLYENSMNNLASQSMQDIYTNYQDNPQKMQEEFAKLDKDLFDNIPDEDTKLKFKSEFILKSGSYINNARNNQKRIQEAQLRQSREQSLINATNTIESSLSNMMSPLANGDDVANFNMAMDDINKLITSRKANGLYEFSPSQQQTFRKGIEKSIADGFYNSMYNMGYDDIDQTLQKLHKDEYTVSYFDDDGNKKEINLKDMVKPETYRDIKNKSFKVKEEKRKSEYFNAHSEFTNNPTQEGFDRLKQLDPKMSKKTEDNLLDILDKVPNQETTTTLKGIEFAKKGLASLQAYQEGTQDENVQFLEDVTSYIKKLRELNKDPNKEDRLSESDMTKYMNLAYRMVNDNVFSEQVHDILGKPDTFDYVKSWFGGVVGGKYQELLESKGKIVEIEQLGLKASAETIALLEQGKPDEAYAVYKKAQEKAIQLRYPSIDFTNKKIGDIIWYPRSNKFFKFMGYSLDDVIVEVEANTGAVK